MGRATAAPLWVCTDCLLALSGYTAHEVGYPLPTPEPGLVTGLVKHPAGCLRRAGGEECECETVAFSVSPCDSCGSLLAGERHAATWAGERP